MKKAESVGIETQTVLDREVDAPVEKGQTLGKILYKKDGAVIREIPLYAEKSVDALSYKDVLKRLLQLFFLGQIPSTDS